MAPIMAVRKRWPDTIHAVTMEGIVDGWERGTFRSACDLSGLRLVRGSADGLAALWPPRVAGMPVGSVRCRECWLATGKKRPRSEYVGVASDE